MYEKRVQDLIRKTLKDVERIHLFVHPLCKEELNEARRFREDAVRMTVLQMSLSIETLLDGLFRRAFLGYKPQLRKRSEKKKREPSGKRERKFEGTTKERTPWIRDQTETRVDLGFNYKESRQQVGQASGIEKQMRSFLVIGHHSQAWPSRVPRDDCLNLSGPESV